MSADTSPKVLIVDDEPTVRRSLARALALDGYEVVSAADGLEAIDLQQRAPADVIVLDVMMPGVDGFGVVRRLRQDDVHTPILLLTARDGLGDRVSGLDLGADDYLVKPYALDELRARLRALLRRVAVPSGEGKVLRFADVELDPTRVLATRAGEPLDLRPTEFTLLETFLRHPRQVVSRAQLHELVWGADHVVSDNNIEVYVGYLRRKLERHGRQRLIHTVRGRGYVLRTAP